jgi:hypothetical protein
MADEIFLKSVLFFVFHSGSVLGRKITWLCEEILDYQYILFHADSFKSSCSYLMRFFRFSLIDPARCICSIYFRYQEQFCSLAVPTLTRFHSTRHFHFKCMRCI